LAASPQENGRTGNGLVPFLKNNACL
jgi:hypothetical protein